MTAVQAASVRGARLRWWEIAGGIVLPILAAAAQVALLQADTVGPWLCWGYAAFGVIALLASTAVSVTPSARSFICGAIFGCAAGSLLSAADHFLYSYFYAWPVALVTIVPFSLAAALVGLRRAANLLAECLGPRLRLVATLGAFVTFSVPAGAQIAETQWVAATVAHLWDGDTALAAAAVRAFNDYPLRFGRFATDVCEQLVIGRRDDWYPDQELVRQLTIMLGPDFHDCQPRDPHG